MRTLAFAVTLALLPMPVGKSKEPVATSSLDDDLKKYHARFDRTFRGRIEYAGGESSALKVDQSLASDARRFADWAESLFRSRAADGCASSQFQLGLIYRIFGEALAPVDEKFAAQSIVLAKSHARLAFQQQHPGAAEILAQLSRGAEERFQYRRFAMEHGCETAAHQIYRDADACERLYESAGELFYLGTLDLFYTISRGQRIDYMADFRIPIYKRLGEASLFLSLEDDGAKTEAAMEKKAADTYNEFVRRNYRRGELRLDRP